MEAAYLRGEPVSATVLINDDDGQVTTKRMTVARTLPPDPPMYKAAGALFYGDVIRLADGRQVSVERTDVRHRDGEAVVSIYAEPDGRLVALLRPTDRVVYIGGM